MAPAKGVRRLTTATPLVLTLQLGLVITLVTGSSTLIICVVTEVSLNALEAVSVTVYSPGADPNTAAAIYHASGDVGVGGGIKIR